jgi:hypothetical protein
VAIPAVAAIDKAIAVIMMRLMMFLLRLSPRGLRNDQRINAETSA